MSKLSIEKRATKDCISLMQIVGLNKSQSLHVRKLFEEVIRRECKCVYEQMRSSHLRSISALSKS